MPWKFLADAVTGLHLLAMAFFAVSAVMLAAGFFKARRNWKIFFWVFIGGVVALQIALSTKILKACPATSLEYTLRSHYDSSGSYVRSHSLLATTMLNVTGITVPEYILTIAMVLGLLIMVISLIFWKPQAKGSEHKFKIKYQKPK